LSPQSVYFDAYHDTDGYTVSGGHYADWADDLINAGYTVVEYNQPIDLTTLSGHQVLALFGPEIALTTAEITAINDFMQNGGRVVISGEWGNYGGINTVLNTLSTGHGIIFNTDMVYDDTDNDGGTNYWPLIYNFADNPLVRDVNTVVLYAGCSLSLGGSAVPLATGDSDTYASTLVATGDVADGIDENGIGSSNPFIQPQAIIPGAPVVMAYTPVGDGELIAVSGWRWHRIAR
jgi:hypothetical protein